MKLEDIYNDQDLRTKYEDYSYVNKGIKSGYPWIAYVLSEIQKSNINENIDNVILSMFSRYLGNVWLNKSIDILEIKNNLNFDVKDPSLIHGLSGIGIFLIKLYSNNKDQNILITINEIADNLIKNKFVYKKNGLLYGALGISFAFDYGSCGVVMFLNRLLKEEKYHT